MATATDHVKNIKALLECSICTETCMNATMSCYHPFCKHCLANFVATQKKAVKAGAKVPEIFEYSVCRTTFHVKEGEFKSSSKHQTTFSTTCWNCSLLSFYTTSPACKLLNASHVMLEILPPADAYHARAICVLNV